MELTTWYLVSITYVRTTKLVSCSPINITLGISCLPRVLCTTVNRYCLFTLSCYSTGSITVCYCIHLQNLTINRFCDVSLKNPSQIYFPILQVITSAEVFCGVSFNAVECWPLLVPRVNSRHAAIHSGSTGYLNLNIFVIHILAGRSLIKWSKEETACLCVVDLLNTLKMVLYLFTMNLTHKSWTKAPDRNSKADTFLTCLLYCADTTENHDYILLPFS